MYQGSQTTRPFNFSNSNSCLSAFCQKLVIPPIPLTDSEVDHTLRAMEDLIRYRLRMTEIIPIEMARYRVGDGRVHFTVAKCFETSLSLRGAGDNDGWFFVSVKFLFNVGGDVTGIQGMVFHRSYFAAIFSQF